MRSWVRTTGRNRVEIQLMDMVGFEDGKVIEHWGVGDMATTMRQLGAT